MAEVRAIVQEQRLPIPDRAVAGRLQLVGFGVAECLSQGVAEVWICLVAVAEFDVVRDGDGGEAGAIGIGSPNDGPRIAGLLLRDFDFSH